MSFRLTEDDLASLALIQDRDLADLAADVDLMPDEVIDRRSLLEAVVPRLLELAMREGLPFSKYDAEDLEALPRVHREALAQAMGWRTSVGAMLRRGKKVYKVYRNERPSSQVPVMLPSVLPILARWAAERRQ